MTETEEKFYKTFDIKPKWKDCRSKKTTIYTEEQAKEMRKTNRNIQLVYPLITNRILLELICILSTYATINYSSTNIDNLRDEILNHCIKFEFTPFWDIERKNQFKQQIRVLFGEGAEDEI